MISRRIFINLGAFVVVSLVLIVYGVTSLIGNPLRPPTTIYAVFPDGSGMRTHFSVTLNGVDVGSVSSVRLVPDGVRIGMAIDPDVKIPSDVTASIDWANALGEQQVDLQTPGNREASLSPASPAPHGIDPNLPALPGGSGAATISPYPGSGSTPSDPGARSFLAKGATVPVGPDGTPVQVGQVVQVADRLLHSIPVGDLNVLLEQFSEALAGNAGNLRTILESSTRLSREFLAYQQQFVALLEDSPPLLNAVASVGPQLTQALQNTTVLTRILADRRYDLVALMNQGANASQIADLLIASEKPNLACILHDFSRVTANLAQSANLANIDVGLATNQWFFGAIDKVSPQGPAVKLYQGDTPSQQQEWLRTRLLLPPQEPPASPYTAPVAIPPTLPGAACQTAEFGSGVAAASQPGGQQPVPGASLSQPAPGDSQVSG